MPSHPPAIFTPPTGPPGRPVGVYAGGGGEWARRLAKGKARGAAGMNLFDVAGYSNATAGAINAWHNARDPGAASYPINPDLWCAGLLPELTCCVIHKDDCGTGGGAAGQAWRARYGGVAITRRHVLYCGHAFTHAAGTWGVNPAITTPTRLRFMDADGRAVDRVQIHQAAAYYGHSNAATDYGTHFSDACVAVLDDELPESIHVIPLAPSGPLLNGFQTIALSQEWQPQSGGTRSGAMASDYPANNRQMVWCPAVPGLQYHVWSGDSGTPFFTRVGGTLLLAGIISGETAAGHPKYGRTWEELLNLLIGIADANAISLGRLATPTGLTVSVASI